MWFHLGCSLKGNIKEGGGVWVAIVPLQERLRIRGNRSADKKEWIKSAKTYAGPRETSNS